MEQQVKTAIYGAIVGALLSGLLSLGVGFFGLYKSFEMSIQKELINQLRWDINMLKIVSEEMEKNIELLLKGDMIPEIQEVEYKLPIDKLEEELDEVKDKELVAIKNVVKIFIKLQRASDLFRINQAKLPKKRFSTGGWYRSNVSEIDFELSKAISETYQRMTKTNNDIDEVHYTLINNSRILNAANLSRVKGIISDIAVNIEYLSQKRIIELNKLIIKEIDRLEDKRRLILE